MVIVNSNIMVPFLFLGFTIKEITNKLCLIKFYNSV